MAMKGLSVDVSDGSGFFQGFVTDISRMGLSMADLPKRLHGDAKIMTVVVSGQDCNFKMSVRPRWYTHGGVRKAVGAEILSAPWGWTEFVMGFESVDEEAMGGEIRI